MAETPPVPPAPQAPAGPPITGLDWSFLHRTAIVAALTIVVVASTVGMRFYFWGLRYGLTGFLVLMLLGTSAFIFRFLMFERRIMKGLGMVGVKLGLLALFIVSLTAWPLTAPGGGLDRSQFWAVSLGALTPMVVLVLRIVGLMTGGKQRAEIAELARLMAPQPPKPDASRGGTIKPNS